MIQKSESQTPAAMTGRLDLAAYLTRIGYAGPQMASLPVLCALQAAHIAAIPFEAIDALLGEGISLDAARVEDKLLGRGRGGYCFEQNGLFQRVLRTLGFTVRPCIARVLWGGVGDSSFQPRTHMALRVEIAGADWLVDVGFGSAVPTAPLRWDSVIGQDTGLGRYRLVPTPFGRRLDVDGQGQGQWQPVYEVFHEPPRQEEFEVGNWFTSTHPDSLFRRHLIVARATPEGRITLLDSMLTIRAPDGRARREPVPEADLEATLRDSFKLALEPRLMAGLLERGARA